MSYLNDPNNYDCRKPEPPYPSEADYAEATGDCADALNDRGELLRRIDQAAAHLSGVRLEKITACVNRLAEIQYDPLLTDAAMRLSATAVQIDDLTRLWQAAARAELERRYVEWEEAQRRLEELREDAG